MIKYIAISDKEYKKLSEEKRKENSYYIKFSKGGENYIVNGNLHREDGPAVIYSDGSVFWCINDIGYTFKEWLELTPISDEEKVFLRLKYGN